MLLSVSVKNTASDVFPVTFMKAVSSAFVAFLSIALLFSFGCAQKPEPVVREPVPVIEPPMNNSTLAPEQPCSTGNIVQKDDCFLSLAKKRGSAEICKGIYSVETLDNCYSLFAARDLEVCKKITDRGMRTDCLISNAKAANSTEICALIDNADLRFSCLGQVSPPCTLITDIGQRSLCMALDKSDYNLCKGDSCFYTYALNMSDANACQMISQPSERFACVAVVKRDVNECTAIEFQTVKDSCVEMASEQLGYLWGCDVATAGSDYRNRCYLYFAVARNDLDLCKKPLYEDQRDQCYLDFATQRANNTACGRVVESLNKISCYYQAAKANSMPSLCNPLGTENQQSYCYALAINTASGPLPEDCALVGAQLWKDKCYYTVAKKRNDKGYCAMIGPGPDKDSCDLLLGK